MTSPLKWITAVLRCSIGFCAPFVLPAIAPAQPMSPWSGSSTIAATASADASALRTHSLKDSDLPTVETLEVIQITALDAVGSGDVLSEGSDPVTERGICWDTAPDPTVSNSVLSGGSGDGAFFGLRMTNLVPGTLYYVRAWAQNLAGIGYGSNVAFRTLYHIAASCGPHGTTSPEGMQSVPQGSNVLFRITPDPGCRIWNLAVDGVLVGATNAYLFENVSANHSIQALFSGITSVSPSAGSMYGGTVVTIEGSKLSSGADVTNVSLCGVSAKVITQDEAILVVEAGAIGGASTGSVVVCSRDYGVITNLNGYSYYALPVVRTAGVTNIAATGAVGAGEVVTDNGEPVLARGLCWATVTNPTVTNAVALCGSGVGAFAANVTGLQAGTIYHLRAWASNSHDVVYGETIPFRTRLAVVARGGPCGTVSPKGIVEVEDGDTQGFSITPNAGCHAVSLTVDGVAQALTNRYVFENVTACHTLDARFEMDDGRWRFAASADSGTSTMNLELVTEMATAVAQDNAEIFLQCGDLLYYAASADDLRAWTNAVAPLYESNIGVYPIRGNHDYYSAGWTTVFTYLPTNGPTGEIGYTYSFTNRNALFLGVDQFKQANQSVYSVQQPWLSAQLASNRQPHAFVFGHAPAFPTGPHIKYSLDGSVTNRNAFWKSLQAAGVGAYICGHEDFFDCARITDGDGNINNDVLQLTVGTEVETFDADQNYGGPNAPYVPARMFHDTATGYLLGEVDGSRVTLTWKRRAAPARYETAWTYGYSLDARPQWDPVLPMRIKDRPFDVSMIARDGKGRFCPEIAWSVKLSGWRAVPANLEITECILDGYNAVEIQNTGTQTLSTAGWMVALSGTASNGINSVNTLVWALPDSVEAGKILSRSENFRLATYWGGPIDWSGGTNGWAMILDDQGKLADFVAWGWSETNLAAMAPVVSGRTVRVETAFLGNGISLTGTGSVLRVGDRDRNTAADFVWGPQSLGKTNASLTVPFARCDREMPLTDLSVSSFASGLWTGRVSIPEAATGVLVRAACGSQAADSGVFDVLNEGVTIEASAGIHGRVVPAGDVSLPIGSTVEFVVTADPFFHIADVLTNSTTTGGPFGASVNFVWVNAVTDGTFRAEFGADTALGGTPCWWMAEHGLTNLLFDEAETNDADGDGMITADEFVADTNPTNFSSRLAITCVGKTGDDWRVSWQGGTGVVQYLERRMDLRSTAEQWTAVFTNMPPMAESNSATAADATNSMQYYRIRAVR